MLPNCQLTDPAQLRRSRPPFLHVQSCASTALLLGCLPIPGAAWLARGKVLDRAALTGDDVQVGRLAVQLGALGALHGRHRELVPPPGHQVPHRVGHQPPAGDVAALGALAGGHVDDVGLQRGAWSGGIPDYVGRGGRDSGGSQVGWRQRPWMSMEQGRGVKVAGGVFCPEHTLKI